LILALIIGVMGALPASAVADGCDALVPTAAEDQYCERYPGAAGDGPLARNDSTAPRLGNVLSSAQVDRLKKAGPHGSALLLLPVESWEGLRSERDRLLLRSTDDILGRGSLAGVGKSSASGNPIGVIADGLAGGGFTAAFRWILMLSLVGMAGTAWVGHRRRI
jgi:hypothetical protein